MALCNDQQGAAGAGGAAGSAGAAGAGGDDPAMAACVEKCEGELTLVEDCEDEYRDYLRCGYLAPPSYWECGPGEVYTPIYCDEVHISKWSECTTS